MMWISMAFAQTPMVIGSNNELVYVASTTEAAKSKRFAKDAEMSGPVFDPAAPLKVLLREGGMVRVRSGDDYGWLAQALVVSTNPKPSALPSFQIPGAQK